jgi:hypothetical protein
MNITGLGANRLRLKMRIMSDGDLLWLFLDHREECLQEFWEEVHTRKSRWYVIQKQSILDDRRTRKIPSTAKL